MKSYLQNSVLFCFALLCAMLAPQRSHATHVYGTDFFYTHVSGNTYTLTLVVYGDCTGAFTPGSVYLTLPTATPQIQVYNNTSLFTTTSLSLNQTLSGGPNGTEVTPICAAQASSSNCVTPNGTVPGVKKFVYTGNVTLNTTSTNWRFRFTGSLGNSSAGRSSNIDNISGAGSTIMAMEATLNNTVGANNSAQFTVIPTPFFCNLKAASYNPGSVDSNNDSLSIALVAGMNNPSGTVTYLSGYSATQPLSVVGGTFSFTGSNGQLNFTPSGLHYSLVVYRVSEYRNGVLVGTCMREMTFVIRNCPNNPPGATISAAVGATQLNGTTVQACASQGNISFSINPTDQDGDNINMSWSGLPAGATLSVTGNNTTAPAGTFSWNVTGAAPGTYNFFVTFQDDGCPLSSKQTIAYTVVVLPLPTISFTLTKGASCVAKAKVTITPGGLPIPWTIQVKQGSTTLINATGLTGALSDSLLPGTYTISVFNANNCRKDTVITILPPPVVTASLSLAHPLCFGDSSGSITVTGGGGLPPFRYALGNGPFGSANTFSNLPAGNYTVRVLDSNQCSRDTVISLLNPAPILASVVTTKPPCNFFQNGSITVAAYNSVAPYTYALGAGSFGSSGTFGSLYSGSYTIRIKNALGCIRDTLIVLPDSIKIQGGALISPIACFGDSTGSVSITATGTYPPYSYALGNGPFGPANTFSGLPAGTYTFHVQDVDQCYFDTTITLNQPPVISISRSVLHNSCPGGQAGSVTVAAGGGTPPYTYAVNGGTFGSAATIGGLAAGVHTLQVKDSLNCTQSDTFHIQQPPAIVPGASLQQPLCVGSADGSVTLTASGGTAPYTYALGAGAYSSANTFSGLTAGTYLLHIKDANGCIKDTSLTLTDPPVIIPAVSLSHPLCIGYSDGSITLSGSGGTPGYTYALGAGAYSSSGSFTGLGAGTYVLHVKDAHNCIHDTTVSLQDPPPIHAAVTMTKPACNFFQNGALTISAFNSTGPYTYALGAGSYGSSGSFSGLYSGPYTVHIKNALGCQMDTLVILPDSVRIQATALLTHILCHDSATGAVSLSASGAYPPYTYSYDNNPYGSSPAFSGLPAGTYTFHIRDTEQCYFDTTIVLNQPPALNLAPVLSHVSCFGGHNGSIALTVTGGTPGYSYALDSGAYGASATFSNLAAGSYTLHMQDANGCIRDTVLTITQPPALAMSLSLTPPNCHGDTNGSVSVTASGGTPGYQYALDAAPFGSNAVIGSLTAGSYTIHLKDTLGCLLDSLLQLSQPDPIVPSAIVTPSTCATLANGQVILSATGGTQPYTFAVGAGAFSSTATFSNLAAGSYTFHIKDGHNCTKDTVIQIVDSLVIAAAMQLTHINCFGDSSGIISLTPSGGFSPYTFALNGGAYGTASTFSVLPAGNYTINVQDSNGCILGLNATLNQPGPLSASSITITQPSCFGGNNGSIQLTATGGTPGYTYAINGGSYGPGATFTNIAAGTDTLYIKDQNGCVHDTVVSTGQPTELRIALIAISPNKCFGDQTGAVSVTGTGGSPPYSIAYDAMPYVPGTSLSNMSAGTHTIHLKDAHGCVRDSVITIAQPGRLRLLANVTTPTCEGFKDGSIVLSGAGGTPAYTYSRDQVSYNNTTQFLSLPEGTYSYYIQDANGCKADTTITLTGYPHIVVQGADLKPVSCYGLWDGRISLNVSGGMQPLIYQRPGAMAQSSPVFDSLKAGKYTITVTDDKGCKKDTSLLITSPDKLVLTALTVPNDCEGYDDAGSARIEVQGGTSPYQYLWATSPAQTGPAITGMRNGVFKAWVTDANNCQDSVLARIGYDNCCKPFVPDAFTPNGDGKNDQFRMRFKGDIKLLQFSVYDRYGARMFTTIYPDNGWDGTYRGVPVELGVYYYYIKIICGDKGDQTMEFKGDVTLIR